jgi:bacteriorhodopsin
LRNPRSILEEEAAAEEEPVVTFPDDYPNSVRHFLLIGFLGMFIGAIVFFYMGISRKVNTITHVLTFFIAAVAACAYYAMWAGLGVEYKTTDTTPRVIFWARYLDWVVTTPVCPLSSACFAFYMFIAYSTTWYEGSRPNREPIT